MGIPGWTAPAKSPRVVRVFPGTKSKIFASGNDEYYTPKDEWLNIKKYIPKPYTIW